MCVYICKNSILIYFQFIFCFNILFYPCTPRTIQFLLLHNYFIDLQSLQPMMPSCHSTYSQTSISLLSIFPFFSSFMCMSECMRGQVSVCLSVCLSVCQPSITHTDTSTHTGDFICFSAIYDNSHARTMIDTCTYLHTDTTQAIWTTRPLASSCSQPELILPTCY